MLTIATLTTIFFVMINPGSLCLCFLSPITNTVVRSSCYSIFSANRHTTMMRNTNDNEGNLGNDMPIMNRREILSKTILAPSLLLTTLLSNPNNAKADIEGIATPSPADPNPTISQAPGEKDGVVLFTTKSGLRYIDLREGTSPSRTPRYGDLCQISYRAYIKLPGANSDLQQYDSDKAYLTKHGNGRLIPGLDEGLHTLAVGGKRRIIIPPKLGYIGPGVLGPLPESPLGRYKLNKLLDSMVELKGGNVVVDVELRSVIPDEADQGYYDDSTIEPEDFETLRVNLSATAREAKERGESAVDFFDGIAQP